MSFRTIAADLLTTDTFVCRMPEFQTGVARLAIANIDGSNTRTCTLKIKKAGSTTLTTIGVISVSAATSVAYGAPIALESGDELYATGSNANDIKISGALADGAPPPNQNLLEQLYIGSFTYDSNTTTPAAEPVRTVPQPVIDLLLNRVRGCVLNLNGTVNYYLNDSNWATRQIGGGSDLGGSYTDGSGNVMTEVPRFYFRESKLGTKTTWEVSPINLPGFRLHPAFIKDGVEVPHRYYSAYDACVWRNAIAISGATQANPVSITSTNHGLQTGDRVRFASVGGMTQINSNNYSVVRVDNNTFTLKTLAGADVDGTGFGSYTSGGTFSGFASGGNRDNNTAQVNTTANTSTGDRLASVSGIHPAVGLTRAEFRTLAANIGAGWRQLDFPLWCAVGMLYAVEYQTFFNQNVLGDGNTNNAYVGSSDPQEDSPHSPAGLQNGIGNGSTTTANGQGAATQPGTVAMKYRGIENLFGNVWNWADAINVNVSGTGNVHIANGNDRDNYADNTASGHTLVTNSLTTSSANIRSFLPDTGGYFLANATGGTDSQYVTDRHFGSSASNRVVLVGGDAGFGGNAGVFALHALNASSTRGRSVGARLAF
jgi:hypothetical protein